MLRTTFATHFQRYGNAKDWQSAMRHAAATMTLEVYQRELPEATYTAVEAFEREIMSLVAAA